MYIVTITNIIRDVVCEILLRDVENLLEKYMVRTRKVSTTAASTIMLCLYFFIVSLFAYLVFVCVFRRVTAGCIGIKRTSVATNNTET